MKVIYVAAPYTKGDVLNIRKVIEGGDRLLELGYIPFLPHLTHFWHFISPKPLEKWYEIDKAFLERCDAVLRLPGESVGADAEVNLAYRLGIPVYHGFEELVRMKREVDSEHY